MIRSWKVNLYVASILAFSIYFGFGMIIPMFPLFVLELGGGGLEIGILGSAFMVTRAFLARPFGKISDRIGRKKVIITGMFLYALLAFLFTIPDDWWGIILVRVLQGTASAMVWPVAQALVVDSAPPSQRTRAISKYIMISNTGMVAGPLISGGIMLLFSNVFHLSTLDTLRVPFYFASGLALVSAVFGSVYLRDRLTVKNIDSQKEVEKKAYSRMSKRARLSLNMLYANSFFEGFSWSMGSVVFALFMALLYDLEGWSFALLFGVAQGLGVIAVLISGNLGDRGRKKPLIVHGSIWGRCSTIVMSLTPLLPFGRILSFITFAGKDVGRQLAQPATQSLQADIVPTRLRGKLIATIQTYMGLGASIGPILGGIIWDLTSRRSYDIFIMELPGYSIPFLLSATMGIIAALLVHRFVHEPKNNKT